MSRAFLPLALGFLTFAGFSSGGASAASGARSGKCQAREA